MTHTASSERLIQNMIGSEVIAQVMDPGTMCAIFELDEKSDDSGVDMEFPSSSQPHFSSQLEWYILSLITSSMARRMLDRKIGQGWVRSVSRIHRLLDAVNQ